MADNSQIKATQERIFRIAQRQGLTLKAISLDAQIPYNTLRNYAGNNGETAEMPVSALNKLVGVIPDELLSLLLPQGRVIVQAPSELDHDTIAPILRDYLSAKDDAHHPESEAGRDIGPNECRNLRVKLAAVNGRAA